jgi:hypothetical protein
MNPLNPKKLLLSKWTAVMTVAKQKHFLVSRVFNLMIPLPRLSRWRLKRCFLRPCR